MIAPLVVLLLAVVPPPPNPTFTVSAEAHCAAGDVEWVIDLAASSDAPQWTLVGTSTTLGEWRPEWSGPGTLATTRSKSIQYPVVEIGVTLYGPDAAVDYQSVVVQRPAECAPKLPDPIVDETTGQVVVAYEPLDEARIVVHTVAPWSWCSMAPPW